jgi:hypothetical protein
MPSASRLDELVALLPGTVRRGTAVESQSGERLATGFRDLDVLLDGGLPRGGLTDVVAPGSAGATTLAYRLCIEVTRSALAAWIDAPDALDPASAAAAGIDLERVLWVRPPDLGAALVAAELLLTMGGFPLVLLDVGAQGDAVPAASGPPGRGTGRRPGRRAATPLRALAAPHTWLRLTRAAAGSRSALLVLRRCPSRNQPLLGSFAAVRLDLSPAHPHWEREGGAPELLAGIDLRISVARRKSARQSSAVRIRAS